MGFSLDKTAFAVVDVETTGTNRATDGVVEVACVVVRGGRVVRSFSSLVDPGCAIPPRASAIHHLTADVVRGAPTLDELVPTLDFFCRDAVIVAHNAVFDLAFLPMLADRPVLCTLRLARHCFPEFRSHANQVLRYAFGVHAGSRADTPHRALGDAHVTADVLGVLLQRYRDLGGSDDVDALLAFAAGTIAMRAFPFGKYRDAPIPEIPSDYLRWLLGRGDWFDDDVRANAAAELQRRS